ncbi:GGDEF domain-containing protein [Rhizobium sp. L1K21]|uniref:GGDEF domain-containing protein n=1 Tax=Rhizobium sp. L1K21 TaxID=2954933 RepID=UPI002092BB46|nr:GGDEF domain-containing protein [Rhizobium sp. L1K21]MCO6186305.1 GGDEF domain-containing protein [Rhizobium sp. L1K21]
MGKTFFNSVVDTPQDARRQLVRTTIIAALVFSLFIGLATSYFDPDHVWRILAISVPAEMLTTIVVAGLHIRQSLEGAESRARYRYLSAHDHLSGLKNRHSFLDALKSARAAEAPGFFMIADLDHFKAINDSYGHAAGDAVIRGVGALLSNHDAGRLGGEEFAIILQAKTADDARAKGEAILADMAALEFPVDHPHGKIRVTMSAGIAPLDPQTDLRETYKLADAALYSAKVFGRNRVFLAGEVPEIPGSQPLMKRKTDRFSA